MMDEQEYQGLPDEVETTARRELDASTERQVTAEVGTVKTDLAVGMLRAIVQDARTLHQENGYVPKLRQIFRGNAA